MREIHDDSLGPEKLSVNWPQSDQELESLQTFFNCEVEFGGPHIEMTFSNELLFTPLYCNNPALTQSHERMLDEYLQRLDKSDIVQLVKNKIYEMLPLGSPTQTEIAVQLGMSLRNLQRKLNERDCCYRELLEQIRKKLALDYITQEHLSFSEIGYLVGFSSIANFNRAFKRWTNTTPGAYRKSLQA